jgi:hypothetical protein
MSLKDSSIVIAAIATDYVKANPETTAAQLRQMFPMVAGCEARIIYSVRSVNPPADAETVEAAMKWAVESNAGYAKIRDRFGIGAMESRRIAQAAKDVRKVIDADKIKRMKEAKAFALKNTKIGCKEIAAKFDVSVSILRRWHEEHRAKIIRSEKRKTVSALSPSVAIANTRRCRKLCGLVDRQWVPVDRIPQRVTPDRYSYEIV